MPNCIFAINKNIIWAGCEYGGLLVSTNGGDTWEIIGTADNWFYDIKFLDANVGFATGNY